MRGKYNKIDKSGQVETRGYKLQDMLSFTKVGGEAEGNLNDK